jgi:hypothetical protein
MTAPTTGGGGGPASPPLSILPAYDPARVVNAAPGQLVRGSGPVLADSRYLLCGDRDLCADGTLWHCWNLLNTLTAPGAAFIDGLAQYGIRSCTYAGWSELPDLGELTTPEALAAVAAQLRPDADTIPILITRAQAPGTCTTYCAWHSVDTSGAPFAYCPFPVCDVCYPWGDPLSGLTRVLTHELAETLTDPRADGSGWLFPDGEESDDITPCVWAYPPATIDAGGITYQYQQYWSNAAGGCGG